MKTKEKERERERTLQSWRQEGRKEKGVGGETGVTYEVGNGIEPTLSSWREGGRGGSGGKEGTRLPSSPPPII